MRFRRSARARAVLIACSALATLPGAAYAAPTTRLIVKHDADLSASERADIRADAGAKLAEKLSLPNTEVVTVPAADAKSALRELNADPDVRYAERDSVMHAMEDEFFKYEWALDNTGEFFGGTPDADIDAPAAWNSSTGTGISVAVVDTSVQSTHPDLAGHVTGSVDYTGGAPRNPNGVGYEHGTHVAGIIAALRGNNGIGVEGVAPSARVKSFRALRDSGSGSTADIADAFYDAGQQGFRIVNASLGGSVDDQTLEDAITAHPGTLYVVAAGNDGVNNDSRQEYPCDFTAANILCVGATDQDDNRASFSNFGHTNVDLFAPGTTILSTVPQDWPDAIAGGYAFLDGTSMATPMVSGIAALALARNASLSTAQLKQAILSGADPKTQLSALSVSGARANAMGTLQRVPPDRDGDGILDAADRCPTIRAPGTADGCLPPRTTPTPSPSPIATRPPATAPVTTSGPLDRDGDGRPDPLDACPAERAISANGCPVPSLRKLSARATPKRCKAHRKCRKAVRVRVVPDRAAQATVRLDRRVCRNGHCRWRKVGKHVLVLSASGRTTKFKGRHGRGLKRGRYRVRVVLTSSAGTGAKAAKRLKV